MRKISVVTVGRSDFSIYQSLLSEIQKHADLEMNFMATGAHFAADWGSTFKDIEAQGYSYERGLEMLLNSDTPQGMAKSLGVGVMSFSQSFAVNCPDMLVVLGDRLEMLCPVIASLPYNIPVIHLYGGKVTEGAVDDRVRHAITKMSHLHFVSCEVYRERVLQMGEEPWRVFNVGLCGLDRFLQHKPSERSELCKKLDINPEDPFLLVTYHPVTLEGDDQDYQVESLLSALEEYTGQIVITYPNADPGNARVISAIEGFAEQHPGRVYLLKNAGTLLYPDLLHHAAAMVGNSSSGIAEAPSFELPVVNIGTRQDGAVKAENIIDCEYDSASIVSAIKQATSETFRKSLKGMKNPYGDGTAGKRIVDTLSTISIDDRLMRKMFIDRSCDG